MTHSTCIDQCTVLVKYYTYVLYFRPKTPVQSSTTKSRWAASKKKKIHVVRSDSDEEGDSESNSPAEKTEDARRHIRFAPSDEDEKNKIDERAESLDALYHEEDEEYGPPMTKRSLLAECLREGKDQLAQAASRARTVVQQESRRRELQGRPWTDVEVRTILARAVAKEQARTEAKLEEKMLSQSNMAASAITPSLYRKYEDSLQKDLSLWEEQQLKEHASFRQTMPRGREVDMLSEPKKRKMALSRMHQRNGEKKATVNMYAKLNDIDQRSVHQVLTTPSPPTNEWTDRVLASLKDRTAASKATVEADEAHDNLKEGESVEEPEPMVDLTVARADKNAFEIMFDLGEGYQIECGMVSYTAGTLHGCYEAVTIKKQMPASARTKNPAPLTIVIAVRALQSLQLAMESIREAFQSMVKLPTMAELNEATRLAPGKSVDLTTYARVLPKLSFKLDDMITLKSEKVKWGKATVDVLTFARLNKDPAKNPFTIQLPATLFPLLEVAVKFIHFKKFNRDQ